MAYFESDAGFLEQTRVLMLDFDGQSLGYATMSYADWLDHISGHWSTLVVYGLWKCGTSTITIVSAITPIQACLIAYSEKIEVTKQLFGYIVYVWDIIYETHGVIVVFSKKCH